jgi:hypothetical protein
MVSFGANDDLFFVALGENTSQFVRTDWNGSRRARVSTFGPIINRGGVSPDGSWVVLYASGDDPAPATFAVPLDGGAPRKICTILCYSWWSRDGASLFVRLNDRRTLVIPIPPGQKVPDIPNGVDVPPDQLAIHGLRVIDNGEVIPGANPSTYVYVKAESRRILYLVPLR